MSYATRGQLEVHLGADRFVDVTDRRRTGVPDDAAITQALENASSTADSYLAAFLPITPVPSSLLREIFAIAVYELVGNAATEDERLRYEDAMRWLRDVQASRAALTSAIAVGGTPLIEAAEAKFTHEQTRRIL